jgi:hypothetical protein
MADFSDIPFKVDGRYRGSVRMAELYRADAHKPDRARILTNIANIAGEDLYRGNLEIVYNYFKEHRQTGGRVGQCIGGEWLRRGNNISFRLRNVAGEVQEKAGYRKDAWVGDDHYDFLVKVQAALNCSEGEWQDFLAKESKPKGDYRSRADSDSRAIEEKLIEADEDLRLRPGTWAFYALRLIREDIKDPKVAEAVALYDAYPASLDPDTKRLAVEYYMQFFPHKVVGFQSIDNVKFLAEDLESLDKSTSFRPVRIYRGPAEADLSERPIESTFKGDITTAGVRGLLRSVRKELGKSVTQAQRDYNRSLLARYFGEFGEQPWVPYKESIGILRSAVQQDRPIVRARLSHDEKAKEELPKRTRLGENYRRSVHFLDLIDKGLNGGKETEWQATLDLVPMRLAQPYISAAFTVIQQERMRND